MTDPNGTTIDADGPTRVLELRVHGVNNTTPAALLDLPLDSIELAAGDTLGSFWQPTAAALEAQKAPGRPGKRGDVPDRIAREAYSWGGMVRTTPNFGGAGPAGRVVGVLARIFYTMILPFSLGNAAQWTRRLSVIPLGEPEARAWAAGPDGRRSRRTAGAARLFGLVLTLLFTTTAATWRWMSVQLSARRWRPCVDPWRASSRCSPTGRADAASRCSRSLRSPRSSCCGWCRRSRRCGTTSCRAWRRASTRRMAIPYRRTPCSRSPASGRIG